MKIPDNQTSTDARGVTCRKNGKIARNPDSEPLPVNEIPSHDFERLPAWLQGSNIMMNIPSGRGCPWRCFFCTETAFWGRPRQRSAKEVAEEISNVVSKLHVKQIRFSDDTFAFDKKFLAELVAQFASYDIDLQFAEVWARVDTVNREVLAQISELAQNVQICYGIESGNDQVLRAMRKGITVEQAIQALRRTNEQGIYPTCFWIVGHPGSSPQEEKTSTDLTCKMIDEDLCASHEVSVFQPYPGSEAFTSPQSGVIIDNYEWNRYVEQPPFFPPVSHLVNFSPVQIMLAYQEMRGRYYEHLAQKMGVDLRNTFQL